MKASAKLLLLFFLLHGSHGGLKKTNILFCIWFNAMCLRGFRFKIPEISLPLLYLEHLLPNTS